MESIAFGRTDVIIGVDTHKEEHVAVALDGLGGRLGEHFAPANLEGYASIVNWASGLGTIAVFGVEGCGSYGSGIYRFLRRGGHKVIEVNRPARKGERRLSGKSDVIECRMRP